MPVLSWQAVVVGDPLCAASGTQTLSGSEIDAGIDSVTELPAFFSKRRLDGIVSAFPWDS